MGRPYSGRRAAERRVEAEGKVPVEELRDLAGAGVWSLIRWAMEGKRAGPGSPRVYLDAVFSREHGWFSSRAAVLRFLAELRDDPQPAGQEDGSAAAAAT